MGGGNTNSITLTVSGSPDDLETGLQLAHLLLTEPKVEPAAFSQFTTMIRTMLQQMEKNPMMVGMQAVSGAPYPADVAAYAAADDRTSWTDSTSPPRRRSSIG